MCAKFRDEAQTQRIDIDQKCAMDDDEKQPLHPNRSMCVGSDVQRRISAPHSGTFLYSQKCQTSRLSWHRDGRYIPKSNCPGLNLTISSVSIVGQRGRSSGKREGTYIAVTLQTIHDARSRSRRSTVAAQSEVCTHARAVRR